MLQGLLEMGLELDVRRRGTYFWLAHRLIAWDVGAEFTWLVADCVGVT